MHAIFWRATWGGLITERLCPWYVPYYYDMRLDAIFVMMLQSPQLHLQLPIVDPYLWWRDFRRGSLTVPRMKVILTDPFTRILMGVPLTILQNLHMVDKAWTMFSPHLRFHMILQLLCETWSTLCTPVTTFAKSPWWTSLQMSYDSHLIFHLYETQGETEALQGKKKKTLAAFWTRTVYSVYFYGIG